MQPDPLMLGASDLSNPQSLNLYSYVQNDPINATDPSGLFLQAPPNPGWNELFWGWLFGGPSIGGGGDLFDGGGSGGGGGGALPPAGSPVPVPPITNPQNACEGFALSLVHRLWNGYAAVNPDRADLYANVGRQMARNGLDNVDGNGTKYEKRFTPIVGFKNELVANNQGSDVYRHILFAAGNTLVGGVSGTVGGILFEAYDWQQAARGRAESKTELLDDKAGFAVGAAMLRTAQAGRAGDYNGQLYNEIKKILCN